MFDLKMPFADALSVSLIGIITVICILAVIACLILLVSKLIRAIEDKANSKKEAVTPVEKTNDPKGVPMPEGMNQGELELVGTDEKTAAIIMAIVSDKSGIPLNRLSFKSIKLMEDK